MRRIVRMTMMRAPGEECAHASDQSHSLTLGALTEPEASATGRTHSLTLGALTEPGRQRPVLTLSYARRSDGAEGVSGSRCAGDDGLRGSKVDVRAGRAVPRLRHERVERRGCRGASEAHAATCCPAAAERAWLAPLKCPLPAALWSEPRTGSTSSAPPAELFEQYPIPARGVRAARGNVTLQT